MVLLKDHFNKLLPKAEGTAAVLMTLMPNLRGPGQRKRRLYANVIHSIILYGAEVISRNKAVREKLRRVQRGVALRVTSAYRTVSHEASAILAGQIPLDILANEYARVFSRICALPRKTKKKISTRVSQKLSGFLLEHIFKFLTLRFG